MKLRSIFVFTHDSIGLGEDGPTHQSVEHAASLRLIPHLDVWRPCDTVETAVAWARGARAQRRPVGAAVHAAERRVRDARAAQTAADIARGGYVLADFAGDRMRARAVVIATGSEVPLALGAREALAAGRHRRARRVDAVHAAFDRQDAAYRARVLPPGVPRARRRGRHDRRLAQVRRRRRRSARAGVVGIDRFGESAPAAVLFKHFGFTVEHVAQRCATCVATRAASNDDRASAARRPTTRPPSRACASTAGAPRTAA